MHSSISDIKRSVDDLIRLAQPTTLKLRLRLCEFIEHYHDNPELTPFLVSRTREQVRDFGWACFDAAWAAALMELRTPGGPDFKLPAARKAWYVRTILYCHSDLNGCLGLRRYAAPDSVFGMAVAKKLPGDYAGRLTWCDGRPLTETPLPALKKPMQTIQIEPAQAELFEVAG